MEDDMSKHNRETRKNTLQRVSDLEKQLTDAEKDWVSTSDATLELDERLEKLEKRTNSRVRAMVKKRFQQFETTNRRIALNWNELTRQAKEYQQLIAALREEVNQLKKPLLRRIYERILRG
jgi:predicted  nucleic acid-binding Zn-ribbon protein